MNDPSTYWLTVMNVALGVIVVVCCAVVAFGVAQEVVAGRRKRAAAAGIDREVSNMLAAYDSHAFHSPELGLTMADGGEPMKKEER